MTTTYREVYLGDGYVAPAVVPFQAQAAPLSAASDHDTSSLLLSASPAGFLDGQINSGAVAGYACLVDSATVPSNGTFAPALFWPVPANSAIDLNASPAIACENGVVLVFSSTKPPLLTLSATAWFTGRVIT